MASANDFVVESGVLRTYRGSDAAVTIPVGITAIGDGAFKGNGVMTSVRVPDGVKAIGKSAFEGCVSLSEISLPASVEIIGDSAFHGCTSVRLITSMPKNLKKIGAFAFSGCSYLWRMTIPEGTEEIGVCAFFDNASMESVTLPVSLKVIGTNAFSLCPRFFGVVYRGTRKEWKALDLKDNIPLKKATKIFKYKG